MTLTKHSCGIMNVCMQFELKFNPVCEDFVYKLRVPKYLFKARANHYPLVSINQHESFQSVQKANRMDLCNNLYCSQFVIEMKHHLPISV
jgi:hypothetical protein